LPKKNTGRGDKKNLYDGDGEWDYIYNSDTSALEEYVTETSEDKKSTPSLGFIGVIFVILFFIFIIHKEKTIPKKTSLVSKAYSICIPKR